MRRPLVAVPIALALALAAGVAAVSGAFSSGGSKPSHMVAAASTAAQMPMPTASSGSKSSPTVELHRGVAQVKISNFAFRPTRIVVSPGTKFVWTNEDSDPHTVTTDQRFSSEHSIPAHGSQRS